jgi:hypothetical protein
VELNFSIGDESATFSRNDMTGRSELRVGNDVRMLQSPWRLSTHLNFKTRTVWTEQVGEHEVRIEKTRPRMYGGLRENSFKVQVDGQLVAEATGK